MDSLHYFCCICLKNYDLIQLVYSGTVNDINYYTKLIATVPEMSFNELNEQGMICIECSTKLNAVYDFRVLCLNSKPKLIDLIYRRSITREDIISATVKADTDDIQQNRQLDVQSETNDNSSDFVKIESIPDTELLQENCTYECEGNSMTISIINSDSMDKNEITMISNVQETPEIHIERVVDSRPDKVPKIFDCNICDKNYSRKVHLDRHMKIHTNVKGFSCDFCEKKFLEKSDLIRHIRIHTGNKPFLCSFCGKTFAQKAHYKLHVANHTGDKNFICENENCGKTFTSKYRLKLHTLVHTGQDVRLKKCFVPICLHTTHNSKKIFIAVPGVTNKPERINWFNAVDRKITYDNATYCCEDHFDLEKDADNWMEYKIFAKKIRMKKGALPHLHIKSNNPIDAEFSQLSESDRERKSKNNEDFQKMKSQTSTSFAENEPLAQVRLRTQYAILVTPEL